MSYQPVIPANLHLVADPAVTPLYSHDCDHCNFLGRFQDEAGRECDLYFHGGTQDTTLARYSSEGSDYSSSIYSAYGSHAALTEARRRAHKLNLYPYKVLEALSYFKPGTDSEAELIATLPDTDEIKAYLLLRSGDIPASLEILRTLVLQRREARAALDLLNDGPTSASMVEDEYRRMVGLYENGTTAVPRMVWDICQEQAQLFNELAEEELLARPEIQLED